MSHDPKVFLSGFGAFEQFGLNPSGALVEHLLRKPPPGIEVTGVVLPVSFGRSSAVLSAALDAACSDPPPQLFLGLGVYRGLEFRCELRARSTFSIASRPDVDGVRAGGPAALVGGEQADLWTETEECMRSFIARRENWYLSSNAGGYVCEHVYRQLLEAGEERSCPALFVHVPPAGSMSVDRQAQELEELLVWYGTRFISH